MTRTLMTAAVQLDATPAPVSDRLIRAAHQINQAVAAGAQLVVLPELFNTGYCYDDQNYALAEPISGQTITWMKDQAAAHQVYLAGSLLLLDGTDMFNALLLVAPDGQYWRYNKNFPWAWERAYFREGHGVTIAATPIGTFGLLICWDYAHPALWQEYAGRVDAMIIASCPPMAHKFITTLPSGRTLDITSSIRFTRDEGNPFGADMNRLTSWLGVPLVHTTGSGMFDSALPAPRMALPMLAGTPDAIPDFLSDPARARISAGYYAETKIVSADGAVMIQVTEQGDQLVTAPITLKNTFPQPTMRRPGTVNLPISYFISDLYIPTTMIPQYRKGLRRQYGTHMAPVRARTWLGAAIGLLLFGMLIVLWWMSRD